MFSLAVVVVVCLFAAWTQHRRSEERRGDNKLLHQLFSEALQYAKAGNVEEAVNAASMDRQLRKIEEAPVATTPKRNETEEERFIRELEEQGKASNPDGDWEAL